MTTVELPPLAVVRAEVRAVDPVSPSFVRITFSGPGLDGFGHPGATFDQRVKVIFPPASGILPPMSDGADWYAEWTALPDGERGTMRTYSLREVRIDAERGETEVVIDFVLHLAEGKTGPASTWAAAAAVGDAVTLVGPRRDVLDYGGMEYDPGAADSILLAGDETAAPAIARILEDSPDDVRGAAFIEIPTADDALAIDAPEGVAVHWLPRDGGAFGSALHPAVLGHLGAAAESDADDTDGIGDELVWETPTFSATGEDITGGSTAAVDRYYWIAGESRVVTGLRRYLVKELGVERGRVAFMGYWRDGVAMKG